MAKKYQLFRSFPLVNLFDLKAISSNNVTFDVICDMSKIYMKTLIHMKINRVWDKTSYGEGK